MAVYRKPPAGAPVALQEAPEHILGGNGVSSDVARADHAHDGTGIPPVTTITIHTHDGSGSNSTIVGGVAEAGASVPTGSSSEIVVIGDYAAAGSTSGNVVIGSGTSASNAARVAATGGDNTVIGHNASLGPVSLATGSVVIGANAVGTADNNGPLLVVGNSAAATGIRATVIGPSASGQQYDTVVGYNAVAKSSTTAGNVVIGQSAQGKTSANANIAQSVAVGDSCVVRANNSVSIGYATTAGGTAGAGAGSSAFGVGAQATGSRSLAVGGFDNITGAGASATGTDSIAVGRSSSASATDAIAIGDGATASVADAIALGKSAAAPGGIAIGPSAQTRASSTAIGASVSIGSGGSGVAVGNAASIGAGVTNGTAVGDNAAASSNYGTALGFSAVALFDDTIAIGRSATAGVSAGTKSIAIGRSSQTNHATSVALGYLATTTKANQLMLGTSSEVVTLPGGVEYRVQTKTNTDYTLTGQDYYVEFSTGNTDRVATLPPATSANVGLTYWIKKIDAGTGKVTVTADTTGTADDIDGAATKDIAATQYHRIGLYVRAADHWSIISGPGAP